MLDDETPESILDSVDLSAIADMPRADKINLLKLFDQAEKLDLYKGFPRWFPEEGPYSRYAYPKHWAFFAGGKYYRERMFRAGNRIGKTIAGAFELANHLTGEYVPGWPGRVFTKAIKAWAIGVSNITTRDILQEEILGSPSNFGTGMLPRKNIINVTMKHGIPNAVDCVEVLHTPTGDSSYLWFKSYEQRRKAFQGTAMDVIWPDEESEDYGIYRECLMRTLISKNNPDGGLILTTATPLFGLTPFMAEFERGAFVPAISMNNGEELPDIQSPDSLEEGEERGPSKMLVTVGMRDVPHLTDKDIDEVLSGEPEFTHKAREFGIPSLGSGNVYTVPVEEFKIEPRQFPPYFKYVYAMDVGYNKTAILWGAYDKDNETLYIYDEFYRTGALPEVVAARCNQQKWMPGVVDPHSGDTNYDGTHLLRIYRKLGMKLMPADNSKEAGIWEVSQLINQGRCKVTSNCVNFFDEYRIYARDEQGSLKKGPSKNDHLMDAWRYMVMSGIRIAKPRPNHFNQMNAGAGFKDFGLGL